MDQRKVLIIGLDGFTWTIGRRLIQDGYMPVLGKLAEAGCHGILKSVIPYETSPAWSSFQTGCYPEKTGIYAFHHFERSSNQIKLNSYHEIQRPSLWELLSLAGKKVVTVNMPLTSPPPSINGVVIPGLTCPGFSEKTVYPPEVYETYLKKNPDYSIVYKEKGLQLDECVNNTIKAERARCDLALQLMNDVDWDVFSYQIQSTDAFQHENWWSVDADAAGYSEAAYLQAAKLYESIDGIIGRLCEQAGESVLTVLVSDHGFCAKKAEIGINTWLSQNGYLSFRRPKQPGLRNQLKEDYPVLKSLARAWGKCKRRAMGLLKKLNKRGSSFFLYSEKMVGHIRETIDLDDTFAFCLGGMAGALYVIGKDDHARTEELIGKLLEAFGPDSEEPLIERIEPVDKRYQKDGAGDVRPDYIISFAKGVEARIGVGGGDEVVRPGVVGGKQTGTHEQEGIFVAGGELVKGGHTFDANIVDWVPTVLSYLSVSIPEHVDGDVLNEAFVKPLEATYSSVDMGDKDEANYSDEQQKLVEKQLEDLGYL